VRASTRREFVAGPAGRIECAVDAPDGPCRGHALVAHPHPLYGGTLDNKVVQTLARAFVELGYEAWRPNFRGVGETEGTHDEGRGELEDLAAIVAHLEPSRLALAGFSFGAGVQVMLAQRVKAERLVLVGVATTRFQLPNVQPGTLVIHGERDDTVPLATVFDWARPQDLPVVVLPGADHFFHRKLHILRGLVRAHCA
jgi:alpha/beta superfamily hydrolase